MAESSSDSPAAQEDKIKQTPPASRDPSGSEKTTGHAIPAVLEEAEEPADRHKETENTTTSHSSEGKNREDLEESLDSLQVALEQTQTENKELYSEVERLKVWLDASSIS